MNAASQPLTIMADWLEIVLTPLVYLAAGALAVYLAWSFRPELRALLQGLGITKISFLGVEISVASIVAAQAARAPEAGMGEEEFERVASLVAPYAAGLRILWVDDRPHLNTRERKSFRAIRIEVVNSLDTSDALEALRRDDYHLIISDIGRGDDSEAGFVMLKQIRQAEVHRPIPVIYYHGTPAENTRRDARAIKLGAVGATYVPGQLYRWALYALMRAAVLDEDDIRYLSSLIPGDVAQRVAGPETRPADRSTRRPRRGRQEAP